MDDRGRTGQRLGQLGRPHRRWIAASGSCVVVTVAVLSGCSVSGGGPTPAADTTSVSGQAGTVKVAGAFIESPGGSGYTAGNDAVANFQLSASGSQWDTLTSVSSPDARSVQLLLFDRMQEQISVPTSSTGEEASAQLVDLDHSLTPGERVPLTFTFTDAGSLTLNVPVH